MGKAVVYIHGKGGDASEADHYTHLFPHYPVIGFPYRSQTPWEAREEFPCYFESIRKEYGPVLLIANSIGAFFAMHALRDSGIEKAFFISPLVDMEELIFAMMYRAGVDEKELTEKGTIITPLGETLSMAYLRWVREHPLSWAVPTSILYGSRDALQSPDTMRAFAKAHNATLTVMENGEHWFHTKEQMEFLDNWITG